MPYQSVIGLEIHVELKTNSKMFCASLNDPEEKNPNTNICPICTGHPGTLPVINEEAVKKVIKTGLALNCQIPESSKFDRKNYFILTYPKATKFLNMIYLFARKVSWKLMGKKLELGEFIWKKIQGD